MAEILINDTNFLDKLPHDTGVYRFYSDKINADNQEELLYVGKAINLNKRVRSYFQQTAQLSPRIKLMVSKIAKIIITIADNEASALILENNFIKTLKPKYNILFRDDKTYPLIRLSTHTFPALEYFRTKQISNTSHDKYFGPYPNVTALKQTLEMLQRLFKLRTCTDRFFHSRKRPCMLYQIKQCSAPCVGLISEREYQIQLNLALKFLHGDYVAITEDLQKQMHGYAKAMQFEEAAIIRDNIRAIEQLQAKQIINNYRKPLNADLILCTEHMDKVVIYLIILRNGLYVGDQHVILNTSDLIDGSDTSGMDVMQLALLTFLPLHYQGSLLSGDNTADHEEKKHAQIDNIFVAHQLPDEFKQLFVAAYKIMLKDNLAKHKFLQALQLMGQNNLANIIRQMHVEHDLSKVVKQFAEQLKLSIPIRRIECIDVSHHHGQDTVASLIVYENGKIDAQKYRLYNLRYTLTGKLIQGDDLLALATVLQRRLVDEKLAPPEIIVVDGGAKQLKILKNIFHNLNLCDRIRSVGISKGLNRDPQLDTIIFDSGESFKFVADCAWFTLVQKLRDEAHRFAITGHRKKQIKRMAISQLDEIANIGSKKRQALVMHFGSVQNIKHKSVAQLCEVPGIGKSLAQQIYEYFH